MDDTIVPCALVGTVIEPSSSGRLTKIPTSRWVIVGYEGYILLVCLIKKLLYFLHINHNPMNSDPKYATSCRDPLVKNVRNVIKSVFGPKNEVYT